MPNIQILDLHVADLIAAGEVVERSPANVPFAGGPFHFYILGGSEFRLRKFPACGCEFAPDPRRRAAPPQEVRYA